ncbi:MAG: tetratricopeptide repeat protein [Pyrinomonadaceae bacterium]
MKMRVAKVIFLTVSAASVFASAGCGRSTEPPAPEVPVAIAAPSPGAGNDTIRFLEKRIERDPEDVIAYNKLAAEYLQQLRESGNTEYLGLARRCVERSLATLPPELNKHALGLLSQIEFSSHNFAAARDHASKLIMIDPGKGYTYQLLFDPLLEMGEYDEANAAFAKMRDLGGVSPIVHVAIEQRFARLALIKGDHAKAVRHFSTALNIANRMPDPPRETAAWCQWQLGETAFAIGDYTEARRYYSESLITYPDYFRSVASLAKVDAAGGDLLSAAKLYEKAIGIFPDPVFVAALGDIYKISGRETDAAAQYSIVEEIERLNAKNGALNGRRMALFYANHDLKPQEAYEAAALEFETRKDIFGADALAWAACKAGRLEEANIAIKEAMRLGTKDAAIYYHAGVIANRSGESSKAVDLLQKALRLNSHFDPLQSSKARELLQELEKSGG